MGWAGFQELLKRNDRFDIRVLARPSRKNRKLLEPYLYNPSVTVVWGDLTCYEDVAAGVSGADYVLHVGGMVSPSADYFPEKTLSVNVTAAENVARAVLAQPHRDEIKVVYIGSVAQYGDRLYPIHWGRTGDPVYASKYDMYSVSKCRAELVIADSGIGRWVSLRQSGILYPGILKQINPTAFHVPVGGMLEWTTVEDSGRLLANVCEDWVPDEFWNRFYNISSGEQYRLANYEFEKRLMGMLGLSVEKVFEPGWFALKNFHGMWYTDADILEDYLHFRENLPLDEYFARMKKSLPFYYSLASLVPAFIIKAFMKKTASEKGLGTLSWIRDNDEDKIAAYYGSYEKYSAVKSWDDVRPADFEKNLPAAFNRGEVKILDHGYDESRSIYTLSVSELHEAAAFRGGRFIGPENNAGTPGVLFEWECEHGHRFFMSLESVLLGGCWCTVCRIDEPEKTASSANVFTSQVLGSPFRG